MVTFARFYGMHVLLLPPATLLLIALHVYLVRKHGVAPAPGDERLPRKKFYPEQVFKDTVAIFAAFAILFVMAAAVRVPLEQLADPTDTTYIPRPEWYFLFLFQTLKLFTGPLEVVGSVVLPGLAMLALILVPFIDRGQMVKVTRRTFAFCVRRAGGHRLDRADGGGGAVDAAGGEAKRRSTTRRPRTGCSFRPGNWRAWRTSARRAARRCHAVGGEGGDCRAGPDADLDPQGRGLDDRAFQASRAMRPGTSMPPIHLSDSQLNSLAAFLLKLNEKNAAALESAPDFAVQGAVVYESNHCGACHLVNGIGMKVGPALNGLSKRESRSWVVEHFADPQKLSPGSIMPRTGFRRGISRI